MLREDTYNVRVSVDGTDLGTWDKMEGGELDSEELTYSPGGLGPTVALGGRRKVENVTVSKIYDPFIHNYFHWLAERTGKGEMIVTRQPLDAEGVANGRIVVWAGKLKNVKAPDIDSEGNDAAIIELEMSCKGSIA